MARSGASAAASPRLFDVRLPALTLQHGGTVEPHHARFQWWGPEADLPVLEQLATAVDARRSTGPVSRETALRVSERKETLDDGVPTVLVVHALTGDARVAGPDGWWGPLIGPGRALDPGWPEDVGRGLELARQLAMLTYRAEPSLDARQHRTAGHPPEAPWSFPVQSYLEHQGRKLRRRFDGRAYLLQLAAMDAHDLDAPPPGTPHGALDAFALCVDVDTDQLFTPAQVDLLADWLTAHGGEARRATLRSPHGHDAFLIEWDGLDPLVRQALGSDP